MESPLLALKVSCSAFYRVRASPTTQFKLVRLPILLLSTSDGFAGSASFKLKDLLFMIFAFASSFFLPDDMCGGLSDAPFLTSKHGVFSLLPKHSAYSPDCSNFFSLLLFALTKRGAKPPQLIPCLLILSFLGGYDLWIFVNGFWNVIVAAVALFECVTCCCKKGCGLTNCRGFFPTMFFFSSCKLPCMLLRGSSATLRFVMFDFKFKLFLLSIRDFCDCYLDRFGGICTLSEIKVVSQVFIVISSCILNSPESKVQSLCSASLTFLDGWGLTDLVTEKMELFALISS